MAGWCKEGVHSLDMAAFSGVYCDSEVVPEILKCKDLLDHVPKQDFLSARVRPVKPLSCPLAPRYFGEISCLVVFRVVLLSPIPRYGTKRCK
jgi:hypothetical protein